MGTKVLGIDPGTAVTGWGVLLGEGSRCRRISSGVLRLSAKASPGERLRKIHDCVRQLVTEYEVDVVSLEKAFVGKNIQSALRLGEARGAVLVAAASLDVPCFEYTPAEVKQSVVGFGRADKAQVARGVGMVLGIPTPSRSDEADAMGVAWCHLQGAALRGRIEAATAGRR